MTQTGDWTSQLLDVSLQSFNSSADNGWGFLKWLEGNTTDETTAYVRLDILDSSGTVLQSNLAGDDILESVSGRFNKSLDLSKYSNVVNVDIKLKFKLTYISGSKPTVSNIELRTKNSW